MVGVEPSVIEVCEVRGAESGGVEAVVREWLREAGCRDLKPSGENVAALCPFHADTHNSFSMSVRTGRYTCFSESCGAHGNAYGFLVRALGWAPRKALAKVKSLALLEEGYEAAHAGADPAGWEASRRMFGGRRWAVGAAEPVAGVHEASTGIYEFCPTYMIERGFTEATLRAWEIGFDFDQEAVTVPVRARGGALLGYTRRRTTVRGGAKYAHLGFARSRVLYGAHKAPAGRGDASPASWWWVGEGAFDALALAQLRGPGAVQVSTLSAKVSAWQTAELAKAPGVVMAFDDDRDGRAATLRVGDDLVCKYGRRHVGVATGYPPGVKDPAQILSDKLGARDINAFTCEVTPFDEWRLDYEARRSRYAGA